MSPRGDSPGPESPGRAVPVAPRRVVVTGGRGLHRGQPVPHLGEGCRASTRSWSWTTSPRGRRQPGRVSTASSSSKASILDAATLDRAVEGADAVVHLAARASVPRSLEDPVATHDVNATGTLRVLEAARQAGGAHVVVASSSSVYGANQVAPGLRGSRTAAAQPLRGEQTGRRGLLACPTPARSGSPCSCSDSSTSSARCSAPGTPMRPSSPPSWPPPSPVTRFPFTATGARPAISPMWEASSVSSPTRSTAAVTAPGPVNLAFGGRASLLELARQPRRGRSAVRCRWPTGPTRAGRRPGLAGGSEPSASALSPDRARLARPTACGPRWTGSVRPRRRPRRLRKATLAPPA